MGCQLLKHRHLSDGGLQAREVNVLLRSLQFTRTQDSAFPKRSWKSTRGFLKMVVLHVHSNYGRVTLNSNYRSFRFGCEGEGYRTLARLNFLDWGRAPASYSLNSLKGGYIGDYIRGILGV